MISRVLVLGAVMVLVGAANVQAQDDEEYDEEEAFYQKETAAYMELSLAGSYFKINENDGDDRGSGGVGAIIGGHVGAVRMEIQYEWFDYSATHLATYNLGYTFMPTKRYQPFVKAGIGIMGGRPSHPFLLMGRTDVGVNWFLNEQWVLAPVVGYAGAKHSNHIFIGGVHVAYYFE